jgi:hypothetical protein
MLYRRRRPLVEICVGAAFCGGLAACSVHPLPEDFSRASTVDIVKSIRCEAGVGVAGLMDSLKPEDRLKAAQIIKATMIGYDFDFQITEENSAGGKKGENGSFTTFERSFTSTPSSLDLRASATLNRRNTRNFTIIEPLADLTKKESLALCNDRTKGENWAYPIAGAIGLDEVVRTYLKLELLTELQGIEGGPRPADATGKFPAHVVFSDDLQFTTYLSAGASGKVVLDAVVGRLSVRDASFGVSASRNDIHSVIVALTRKTLDVDERVRSGRASARVRQEAGAKQERQSLVKKVRDPRTQARVIQIDAAASDSVAIELHQRRARKSEDNEPARALGQRLLDVLKVP